MLCCLINGPTAVGTHAVCLPHRLTGRPTCRLTGRLTCRLAGMLTGRLTGRLTHT